MYDIMTTVSLKAKLIEAAIHQLEEFVKNLRDEAKYNLRGESSTDEGGFAGTFGDYSAQSAGNQLKEQAIRNRAEAERNENIIAALKRLQTEISTDTIQLMSLVETNHGSFLIAHALRPIVLDGIKYMFLATDAPIYAEMVGKRAGDTFTFRGIAYEIKNVS